MFQQLTALRDFLAPTRFEAALWAVGFLVLVATWCLWSSRRLGKLVELIRTRDDALWRELGSPRRWDELGTAGNWSTLRRLRRDQGFAQHFDPQVIQTLRELQQAITIGLLVMATLGLFAVFVIWPHR